MSKPPGDLSSPAHRAPWTAEDDRTLARVWKYGADAAAARLGRTAVAVGWRARKLGLKPPSSGFLSLREAARRAGWSYTVVKRVVVALGLEVAYAPRGYRSGPKGATKRWALTPAQWARVAEALRALPGRTYRDLPGARRSTKGRWGVGIKPPHCHRCQRSDRPHRAKGYCGPCVHVLTRRGVPLDGPYRRASADPLAYQEPLVKRVPWSPRTRRAIGPDHLDALVEQAVRRIQEKPCAVLCRAKESSPT